MPGSDVARASRFVPVGHYPFCFLGLFKAMTILWIDSGAFECQNYGIVAKYDNVAKSRNITF
jgi:hypothetical protein